MCTPITGACVYLCELAKADKKGRWILELAIFSDDAVYAGERARAKVISKHVHTHP